jgi:hypothetical protein
MKNRGEGDSGGSDKAAATVGRDRRRTTPRGPSSGSSGRIALILAVVGLILIVVFIIPRGQQKSAEPLPRTSLATGIPINNVDPTSGKPVVAGIASTYKKYTIGHCCAESQKEWEALSESQKDAAVRRFVP